MRLRPAPHQRVPDAPTGIIGYSQATGGFAGSHAQYVRVPFADVGVFPVPDGVPDDAAVFASDALPTGWMAADMYGLSGGEIVAVWVPAASGRWPPGGRQRAAPNHQRHSGLTAELRRMPS